MKRTSKMMKTLGLLLLLCLFPLGTFAQDINVQGTVSADGEPAIGATVKVKGSSQGTVTDIDGNFTLKVKRGEVLEVSYIGFQTKEVTVSQSVINVELASDETVLNEVVVVGYGQMKRSDLTGAVVSVGDKAIEKSVPTSIDQVLQGRAAGVQIQANTGTPGGSASIRIRGTNSLNASSQPIFVIDGVIIDPANGDDNGNSNPLAAINPSDIVTMDILKDASATAIYGSRASNGVIMITTKRGKAGEATITYDGYVGWQSMPKKLDVLNLQEYAQHYNDITDAHIKEASSTYIRADLMGNGTDWQDELFRNAMMTSHNLSITGGNEKTTYAISAGYLDQDGIAIQTGYRRQTLRGNLDTQLKKWLRGGVSFSLTNSRQEVEKNWDIIMTALRSQPTVAVKSPDGSFDGPDDQWMPDNPVALASIKDNYNKKLNFRVNTYLEAEIIKGLTFKTELSADFNQSKYFTYTPDYTFGLKTNDSREGTKTQQTSKYWSWRNILTYQNTFADKHTINVMLGQEMSHNEWSYMRGSGQGYLSNVAKDLRAADPTTTKADEYNVPSALFSYFGRAFYNFDERYLVTFTLRRDGSSKFAQVDDRNWGWFPSAALAWRINNEKFFAPLADTVNNLKLRFGWGTTGNQNVENWAYLATLNTYATPWGTGVLNANNANEKLKWETTYSTNIGLDIALFNNRIELIADWYYKKTKDLLLRADLPAFLGSGAGSNYGVAANPWANVGSLENKGLELTLNTVNIDKKGFQWRSNIVFSLNRNKVTELDTATGTLPRSKQVGSETANATMTVVGKPIAQFWGYKVIGRFDKPEDFYYKDTSGAVKPVALPQGVSIGENGAWLGDYIFEDINGDGVIDTNDETFIGNPEPKFTWGFGNSFSWKGIELSIQFSGSYGNKLLNYTRRFMEITGQTSNSFNSVLDYAHVEKIVADGPDDYRNYHVTNTGTIMPRLYTDSYANKNNRVSDAYIEDGSFIRLQNISLSYTLPKKWISKLYLQNVKVYMNLQNVYTWTKYKGFDPEVGSHQGDALLNGLDYSRYPSPRVYTFGLNISF